MYVDLDFYKNTYKGNLDDSDVENALNKASRHVDTLTYNRILAIGFENLTDYQKGIVKECVCLMADWEAENADYINSVLSSYSLNGASMSFGGSNSSASIINGVAVSKDIYSHLQKSGLCCRTLRGC